MLGVCNGFQVLTEAGLLPGALMRNAGLSFVCRTVGLTVENSQSIFTSGYAAGDRDRASRSRTTTAITRPTPRRSTGSRAKAASRFATPSEVNGSANGIAGLLNDAGNVLGMMPHPERALEPAHGEPGRPPPVRRLARSGRLTAYSAAHSRP